MRACARALHPCARVCMHACVRGRMLACVRARACVRACVSGQESYKPSPLAYHFTSHSMSYNTPTDSFRAVMTETRILSYNNGTPKHVLDDVSQEDMQGCSVVFTVTCSNAKLRCIANVTQPTARLNPSIDYGSAKMSYDTILLIR